MEIHSTAISNLIYFFLKPSVTIRFTEERFLLPESLEQWETGELTKASEEDLYWGYKIIVNGYSSPWYYSQKIFNLRGIFYKEVFESLVSQDESKRKHFLYYLQQVFTDCRNQIYVHREPVEPGITYVYSLDEKRDDTTVILNRILRHRNACLSYSNNQITIHDQAIEKSTDHKEEHFITLYLEEQLRHINEILDYIKRYLEFKQDTFTELSLPESLNSEISKYAKIYPKSFLLSNFQQPLENLTNVFKVLKQEEFISKDTTIKVFRRIFSGDKIITPIQWLGSPGTLRYFIDMLIEKLIINEISKGKWIVTTKCFLNSQGGKFKNTDISEAKIPKNKQILTLLNTAVAYLE